MAVLDILWLIEAVLDFSRLIANGINHLAALNHVPLMEEGAIGLLLYSLNAF